MLTDKRRIKRYKKAVIILALVLSLFMFAILFFTIGVAASQLFEAQTSMDIIYIAESMDGNMSLKGYYKGDGESSASWHSLLVASISDTNHESIQLDINNPSPTQGVVNINTATLNSGNSYIVFECAFKNNGSKMVKMEFTDPETTMSNLTKTQLISRSALSSSDFDTIVDSPSAYSSLAVTGDRDTGNYIDDYIYYYVKLELTDTAQAAQYITSHTWTFSTNYSSSDVVTVSVNNDGGTGGISSVKGLTGACLPVLPTGFEPTKTKPSGYTGNYGIYGYYSTTTNDEQYYRSTGEPTRALATLTNNTLYAQYYVEAYVDSSTLEASWPSGLSKSTRVRVIIPSTATSVKSNGFSYCSGLIGVDIPNTVIEIKNYAFSSCSGLIGVDIPNTIIEIKNYAFQSCTGLTGVVIGNSVTSIGTSAFYGCTGLTGVVIGNSVTTIGNYAFTSCRELTNIVIPESVTSIGKYPFGQCSGLASIMVSSGNTVYHSAGNCIIKTNAKELVVGCKTSVIPNDGSVTSIGEYAFYGCSGLTSIDIPNTIIEIKNYAFQSCTSLNNINIPASVNSFSGRAFENCSGLETLTVDSGNTVYHSAGNCIIETNTKKLVVGCKTSVIPTDGSVTGIGNYAFIDNDGLTYITIPDTVTIIGARAFYGCGSLTSVTLPDTITRICEDAFWSCSNSLYTVYGNARYIGNNDNPYLALIGYTNSKIDSVIIHRDTKIIVDSAFYHTAGGMNSLITVTCDEDCQLEYIGSYAFYYCSGLTSIIIPSCVVSIEDSAFDSCSKLRTVIIDSGYVSSQVMRLGGLRFGNLLGNSSTTYRDTIYVKNGLSVSSDITRYYNLVTSDKTGYMKYAKKS